MSKLTAAQVSARAAAMAAHPAGRGRVRLTPVPSPFVLRYSPLDERLVALVCDADRAATSAGLSRASVQVERMV